MVNENINSIDYKELYTQYNWFKNSYPSVVQQACDEFFLEGFKFVLIGVSKNINTLMDKDAYFVTKVRIDKQHDMFFRSSERAIGIILDRVLGKAGKKFNLNKLTDLEAKIITAFNDHMFNATAKFLSPAPPTLKRTNFDVVHLTFLISDVDSKEVAKFIITLPDVLLNPEAVTSKGDKFDYSDFATSTLDVAVKIGSTRFKLIDVKNIEEDDIVVFDNSNINHMTLKFRDYEKEINLNPNLGLVIPVDNDGGSDMGGENTNLWDSIEVEMHAQFDAVKITLGELKNIEDGLVVDLTSIYNNKVTLSVENKPIARGELVIVNDRYGVKIEEVVAKAPKQKASDETVQSEDDFAEVPMGDNEPVENTQYQEEHTGIPDEEEEFDYSDFELEDEDI